jgi:HlyD family secretion protein
VLFALREKGWQCEKGVTVMGKWKITALVLVILVLGSLAACSTGGQDTITQQPVTVEKGDLALQVTGNGKIETSREARLTFGSGGKLAEIPVKEGDRVATGAVLARLDTGPLQLALNQSGMSLTQAEVAVSQAELARQTAAYNLETTRNSADSLQYALLNAEIARDIARAALDSGIASIDFTAVQAELNKAKAWYDYTLRMSHEATSGVDDWLLALDTAEENLKLAQANYDNVLAGFNSSQVNLRKKQLEAAEVSVELAQKNIDDLDRAVALQELQVAAAERSIDQTRQAVDLARQSVVDAQRQLDEATIIAPFDGVVAQVLAEEGDIVPSPTLAPQPVIRLINPDLLELLIDVDEIDIPLVMLGQAVAVSVDALPDQTFVGKVTAVYPVPVEVGGVVLYKVRISLENPGGYGIKIGMSASADIVAREHRGVLIVPSRAVTRNDQGQAIVKVQQDKEIVERPVEVGLDDGLRAEIISGLSEGETVIVEVKVKSGSMNLF